MGIQMKAALIAILPRNIQIGVTMLIGSKHWKSVETILSNQSAEARTAYKTFLEEYFRENPDEAAKYAADLVASLQQDDEPNTDPEFLRDFQEPLNIVILGETGVGKSTFINAFLNYLKFTTIEKAMENGPHVLIRNKFELTDADFKKIEVETEPTYSLPAGEVETEITEMSKSGTTAARAYVFQLGPEPQQTIRLIDTPGVGDVSGTKQDENNFSNILGYLSDYKKIHAILILLKPNESKLSVTFRYCLEELLSHLHESASKNIIFCYTYARASEYKPGDTHPLLHHYLANEFYSKRNIKIPLNTSTTFFFDSESFRYLCALKKDVPFNEAQRRSFSKSWRVSVEESFRLVNQIKTMKPHNTEVTLNINNIRRVVLMLSRPLAEMGLAIAINKRLIEESKKKYDKFVAQELELSDQPLVTEQLVFRAKEILRPKTVCTAEQCVEVKNIVEGNPDSGTITIHKECHAPCYLDGIQTEVVPNAKLKRCYCFANLSRIIYQYKCSECTCSWETHMHVRYDVVPKHKKVINEQLMIELNNCKSQSEKHRAIAEDCQRKKDKLEEESNTIRKSAASFVIYLRKNSLIPFNDVYLQFADHLITQERIKISKTSCSDHVLKDLQQSRADYEKQISLLEDPEFKEYTKNGAQKVLDIEEINDMINDLGRLSYSGDYLKEVRKLEMLSVRNELKNRAVNIEAGDRWFELED